MLQSKLFYKTLKAAPKDEESVNAKLLVRAGFVDKLMAGVYTYLPLGFLVLRKIEKIIREEMNAVGGQEVSMPALHPKKNWEITDRWKHEEMFKIKSRAKKDYGLGWTHEEVVTPLAKQIISSYKDLPVAVFQIQDKFRDELRAKSGLLRGIEFIMKDMYSFHSAEKDLDDYYEKVKQAYFKIFKRCGIGDKTFLTAASGGAFCKYSHEFQTVTKAGEDEIYLCEKCKIAVNKEIIKEEKNQCPECRNKKLAVKKAIEVGNIFKLKDKFSKAFELVFTAKDGQQELAQMGCYGIGLGRLMGAIAEVCHDNKGIIWPKEVAPFDIHLIQIGEEKAGEKICHDLEKSGQKVLYDDRKENSAGEKFAEADLIGIPTRIVISERTLQKNSVEVKERSKSQAKLVKVKDLPQFFKSK